MGFNRKIINQLNSWKTKEDRKPLVIRGARQVGKTTVVTDFGKTFDHFISLNLEKPAHQRLFEGADSLEQIVNAIFLQSNTPRDNKPTLLFIDEIQESPTAIKQLRYFYEEFPSIHVIAAGSLLEFALKDVGSFPVGRVEQLVLHPFDFEEFLMALGHDAALGALNIIPFPDYAYNTLLQLFHTYTIIGGMPEVVKQYAKDGNMANLRPIYESLWQGYKDDVKKYAQNRTEQNVIRHIMDTAPGEKDRITFGGFGNSNYRSREVGEALRTLDKSRVIQLIYPTTATSAPITANLTRKPRLQFLDTGLLNFALGIQADMIALRDMTDFHRGKIIQHMVVQQFQAQHTAPSFHPSFWVRDKANSSAEVDLVFQQGQRVIPLEVKSGAQGKLKSLHQFMNECDHSMAMRMLANNYSLEQAKTREGKEFTLMNLPYFLAHKIPEYAGQF
ncbi:MAG: AAA family ATPase [Flavobacteriales bacterium]